MKVKTSELTDTALDWVVGKLELVDFYFNEFDGICRYTLTDNLYSPSEEWTQGGPIIEREQIEIVRGKDLIFPRGNENGEYSEPLWLASYGSGRKFHGPTPLVAAMRCYVASRLGDEVNVPDSLMCENEVADEGTARLVTVTMALTCDSDAKAIDTIQCNVSTYQEGDAFQNRANHAGN